MGAMELEYRFVDRWRLPCVKHASFVRRNADEEGERSLLLSRMSLKEACRWGLQVDYGT
jgi:hypothetical protein